MSEHLSSKDGTVGASSKMLTELLLLALAVALVIFVGSVGLATAITRSGWWGRRRRAWQRRIDSTNQNETVTTADHVFYYTNAILEAMSFKTNSEDNSLIKKTKYVRRPSIKDCHEQSGLPLRFHPEKLYGATSTVHRDNLRKKSCSNLSVPLTPSKNRRSSMVDSLLSLSLINKSSSKVSETPSKIFNVTYTFPQDPTSLLPDKKRSVVPHIDITCDGEESHLESIYGSSENLRGQEGKLLSSDLLVALPPRRASSTNFELSSSRKDWNSSADSLLAADDQNEAHSDVETNARKSIVRERLMPGSERLRSLKRASLIESISFLPSMRKPLLSYNQSQTSGSGSHSIKIKQCNESIDSILKEAGSLLQPTDLLTSETVSGGLLALRIKQEGEGENSKFSIQTIAAIGLKSQRPWQKTTYLLRFVFRKSESSQNASVYYKDSEFGTICVREKHKLSFDKCCQLGDEQVDDELQVRIFECHSKWSGEKETFYGLVHIPSISLTSDIAKWYPVVPAYPNIRIKADLLVSLCQRPLKSLISVGVHQIRNIRFETDGPLDVDNLDQFIDRQQLELDMHACLTFEARVVKSKKSVFVQRSTSMNASAKDAGTEYVSEATACSTGETSNRISEGEHFFQFSLPVLRRSASKLPLSNWGILVYLSHKIPINDRLVQHRAINLKDLGIPETKNCNALGECFISDQTSQAEYRRQKALGPKFDTFCASLWSEAILHGSSRVYQWLTVE
ncbi:hypothetical protein EG68_00521 [Paragonimus skrjabini miyazakii]|uniref:Uncharacterized protein n=1 Tax=Paragonimus skrjabini miyazakii TaxID=59628 RepID=A0A8S9Z3V3_9TREM|nr:hypothetical protein EG68_00521 [Paragonimus skrjabini miyazakii]